MFSILTYHITVVKFNNYNGFNISFKILITKKENKLITNYGQHITILKQDNLIYSRRKKIQLTNQIIIDF